MGFLRKIRLHGQCTSEAVATPAQLTSPKPTPTSENGDRCSGWLATTPMTPRPTHLRRPWTGLKRPGFKVFYEIWALHAFGAVRPPTVFQRGPLRKAGIRAGPARCRIHRKGRNSETPANWALRQIPAQSHLGSAQESDRTRNFIGFLKRHVPRATNRSAPGTASSSMFMGSSRRSPSHGQRSAETAH